jgi:hypothetical protein
MRAKDSGSLKWQLVWRLLPLQAGLLIVSVFTIFLAMWAAGAFRDTAGQPLSAMRVLQGTPFVVEYAIMPSLLLMTLTTLVATPIVVRRALARLGDVAKQATEIDIDRRGVRLSADDVPSEVRSLVGGRCTLRGTFARQGGERRSRTSR